MAYERVECPQCGDRYKSLGQHWYHNESHRPELTEYQKEIITGLMMGDGSLYRENKNPYLKVQMITKRYLDWLDEVFGCLSRGVDLNKTAARTAKDSRESGFNENASEENYNDYYCFSTRSLPELYQFDWYTGSNGEKVWPENIDLTPTVLTHWYVGDGSWKNVKSSNYISIGASNEVENTDKIDSYFERANLPRPSNYSKFENRGDYSMGMNIEFAVEDSHTLWQYMAPPPRGFEYKFPKEYR